MLLEHEEAECTTDTIIAAVLHKINPALDSMGKAADQTHGMASDTRMVVDQLYSTGEETRNELQKGADAAFEDIQKATAYLKDEGSKLSIAAASVTNGMGNMEDRQHNVALGRATYADTLNRQLLSDHLSTLARYWVKKGRC